MSQRNARRDISDGVKRCIKAGMTKRQTAAALNATYRQVVYRALQMGLSFHNPYKLDDSDIEEMLRCRDEGMTTREVADYLGVDLKVLSRRAEYRGISFAREGIEKDLDRLAPDKPRPLEEILKDTEYPAFAKVAAAENERMQKRLRGS